jgi:hypothetical protein
MSTIEMLLRIVVIGFCILMLYWIISKTFLYFPKTHNKLFEIFRKKVVYEKYMLGTTSITAMQQNLIKKNQNLLTDHRVPINKIRFVFRPQFTYDIDKNVINSVYYTFFPISGENGLFVKDEPIIEVGKPDNLMLINVGSYKMADNYAYLKETLKRCKIGIVIMINDEIINDIVTGEPIPYKFSVNDEEIRFAVLDDAIEHYKNI